MFCPFDAAPKQEIFFGKWGNSAVKDACCAQIFLRVLRNKPIANAILFVATIPIRSLWLLKVAKRAWRLAGLEGSQFEYFRIESQGGSTLKAGCILEIQRTVTFRAIVKFHN